MNLYVRHMQQRADDVVMRFGPSDPPYSLFRCATSSGSEKLGELPTVTQHGSRFEDRHIFNNKLAYISLNSFDPFTSKNLKKENSYK